MHTLTDQQAAILEFEGSWWTYGAGKEQTLGELFGLSAGEYYQVLSALIDEPAALASAPLLVRRLRRVRDSRLRARSASRAV